MRSKAVPVVNTICCFILCACAMYRDRAVKLNHHIAGRPAQYPYPDRDPSTVIVARIHTLSPKHLASRSNDSSASKSNYNLPQLTQLQTLSTLTHHRRPLRSGLIIVLWFRLEIHADRFRPRCLLRRSHRRMSTTAKTGCT